MSCAKPSARASGRFPTHLGAACTSLASTLEFVSKPKNVLGAICLRASGSVACPWLPCSRELSLFCPVRKGQAKTTARLATNLGILWRFGFGAQKRVVYGRRPNVVLSTFGPNTSRCGGSRRSDKQRERKVGWAVGWAASKSSSRISHVDKYGCKGILGGPPGRHTGDLRECFGASSKLRNFRNAGSLWISLEFS